MIPRVIHFVWFGREMPGWAAANIDEFRRLNPTYEIIVHGEDALAEQYREMYDSLEHPAEKSDLLRYSILQQHGGWYFDVDIFPMRPLDDVVRAWALDGERMYLGQQFREGSISWLNGAVLAVTRDWPGWEALNRMLMATPHRNDAEHNAADGWGAWGPKLLTRFARTYPDWVEIASECWWYGVKPNKAARMFRAVRNGDVRTIRAILPDTGGQLPCGLHLWAALHEAKIDAAISTQPLAAIPAADPPWFEQQESFFGALGQGLERLGYRVESYAPAARNFDQLSDTPDIVAAWNGVRPTAGGDSMTAAQKLGARRLFCEHGFWRRNEYFQIDPRGNQHRASWVERLREPAPANGAVRLSEFFPNGIRETRARDHGYVLVIGQVPNDSQMWESEMQGPLPLQRAVAGAMPHGVPVYFRPHPLCWPPIRRGHKTILRVQAGDDRTGYTRTKESGGSLSDAIAGARFVITINSTAGLEALAQGVPVLAFGPANYTIAGVALKTSLATIAADMRRMLDGWVPHGGTAAVRNFLEWLAARQWRIDELADGKMLAEILGIQAPATKTVAPAGAAPSACRGTVAPCEVTA